MHELILISKLACGVVVGVSVRAPEEDLADEVECMGTAAEATIVCVETHFLRYCKDSRVVVACVIKHKVANF